MRKFIVNVNGNSYEVEVEEVGGVVSAQAPSAAQTAPAAKPAEAAPAAEAEPVKPAPAPAARGPEGSVKITAPMPGTILDVKVSAGQQVKKGTVVAILEAMKMENEILAPQDATVATVNVTKGQQVNTGDVLVTLN